MTLCLNIIQSVKLHHYCCTITLSLWFLRISVENLNLKFLHIVISSWPKGGHSLLKLKSTLYRDACIAKYAPKWWFVVNDDYEPDLKQWFWTSVVSSSCWMNPALGSNYHLWLNAWLPHRNLGILFLPSTSTFILWYKWYTGQISPRREL